MQKFNCKTCGAELYFDPETQKLKCEYCGSSFDPTEFGVWDASQIAEEQAKPQSEQDPDQHQEDHEQEPEKADESQKATDDSEGDLVVYHCANCGADIITARGTAATTCVYCNRAVVLDGNLSGEFKPDYVLPFAQTKEDVEAAYRKLCKESFLTPKLFREESTVKKIKGVYVPFWMHSMHANATLKATGRNFRTWVVGDVEYTEVKSYQIQQEAQGDFDKIPTDALGKMDNDLMDALEPFQYKDLKPFHPAYLAGYYTERFDEAAEVTLPRAQERARQSLHNRMLQEIGAYGNVTVDQEQVNYQDVNSEYGMLPVWMMYTEYKGKNYIFGMNGQTGKMIGEIPKDYGKAALITGGVFLASQILMMLFRLIGGLL